MEPLNHRLAIPEPGQSVMLYAFGIGWDLPSATGRGLVIVGGGCGSEPLRPVVLAALADREWAG